MTLFHFEKTGSFFSPKNLVFKDAELPKSAPENYDQTKALEKFAGKYREIPAGTRIDFKSDNGLGLVAKLVSKMKTMPKFQELTDKQLTGSAVAVAARMSRAGAYSAGFDVNLFKKGSWVEFKGNNQVEIHYVTSVGTPIDTTLDLSDEATLSGPVAASREALRGEFFSVLRDAANREVIYSVADILGYNWANSADKASFMGKLLKFGLNDAKIKELAPEFKGTEQKNRAACRFIKGLLDGSIKYLGANPQQIAEGLKRAGLLRYTEMVEATPAAPTTAEITWAPVAEGELAPEEHEVRPQEAPKSSASAEGGVERKAEPALLPEAEEVFASQDTKRGVEEARKSLESDIASVPEREPPAETEDKTLKDALDYFYIRPEELKTALQSTLEQDFPGIRVSVGTDRKTGKPTNPMLTLTGSVGTESAYVTNTVDRDDLEVWKEHAKKTAKKLRRAVGKPVAMVSEATQLGIDEAERELAEKPFSARATPSETEEEALQEALDMPIPGEGHRLSESTRQEIAKARKALAEEPLPASAIPAQTGDEALQEALDMPLPGEHRLSESAKREIEKAEKEFAEEPIPPPEYDEGPAKADEEVLSEANTESVNSVSDFIETVYGSDGIVLTCVYRGKDVPASAMEFARKHPNVKLVTMNLDGITDTSRLAFLSTNFLEDKSEGVKFVAKKKDGTKFETHAFDNDWEENKLEALYKYTVIPNVSE